ncbi:MAG: glyoxylase I family protein, partial [Phenylobacterium sp.]
MDKTMKIKKIDRITLFVSNMDDSIRFYTGALGFKVTFDKPVAAARLPVLPAVIDRCVRLESDDDVCPIELRQLVSSVPTVNKPVNLTGLIHLALEVDNIFEVYTHALAQGASLILAPTAVPLEFAPEGKRLCYFSDPDGAVIELAEYGKIEMGGYIAIEQYHEEEEKHAYYVEMMTKMTSIISERQVSGKLKILEIGAGTGLYTKRLVQIEHVDVCAVEIDSECCMYLETTAQKHVVQSAQVSCLN